MSDLIYVFGGTSTGKTAILQVFSTELLLNDCSRKVKTVPPEKLLFDFLAMQQLGRHEQFIMHYSNYDLLVIDDFQFLIGRKKALQILTQIFTELIKRETKVLIASSEFDCLNRVLDYNPLLKCKVINLDKNKIDFDKLVKLKARQLGLKRISHTPKLTDVREVEGFLKTHKFLHNVAN
jgi:DNA replication protein DnaC